MIGKSLNFALSFRRQWPAFERAIAGASRARTVSSLFMAAMIPLLLFGASAAFLGAETNRRAARLDVTHTLDRLVDRVTVALVKEVDAAEVLASLPSLDAPDLDRFYRTAQRIAPKRALWETVALADINGSLVMHILRQLGDSLGPVSDRAGFDMAVKTKQPVIGGLGPIGPISGKRLVSISVPVIRDGDVRHVLIIGLSPIELQGILRKAGAPAEWTGTIIDANGNMIAASHAHSEIGQRAGDAVRSAIASAPSGEYKSKTPGGVAVETLYQRLPATNGWTVHFGIPSETLNGPVSRSTILLFLSCAICLFLAACLAYLAAKDLEQRRIEKERLSDLLLASSEERAAVAIEAAELGTWRLDDESAVFSGSSRTRNLLDLPETRFDGKDWIWSSQHLLASAHQDDRARFTQALLEAAQSGAQIQLEYRAQTRAGYRWIRLAGRKMPAIKGYPAASQGSVMQGVVADVHELRTAQTERVALLKLLGEAQEDEQRRIARELHDQIGQTLTGLSLGLKTLERDIESEHLRAKVVWLETLTSEISRDIHRVAADLRPDGLDDLGLTRALSALAAELNRRHSVNFDVQSVGLTERLPAKIENAAFRIVQEGFTNVLKHAHATTASAILEKFETCLRIVVEDDGVGTRLVDDDEFNIAVRVNKLGLFGIRERLASLGGRLHIESAPRQGMSLFIEIPLQNQIGQA